MPRYAPEIPPVWSEAAAVEVIPHRNYKGAYLIVTDKDGGKHSYWFPAGQCRALHREAARALGYAHMGRQPYQRDHTWLDAVEEAVKPLLVLAGALFPKPKIRARQVAEPEFLEDFR